jgi:hypothetical protein
MTRALRSTIVASLALLALAGSVRPARAAPKSAVASAGMSGAIDAATLESRHGVRITQVAVTGGGGLVDLRFTILDPAKAGPLFLDHARPPRLLPEGTSAELEAPRHGAMRSVRMQKDAACFLLFPNARNAIRPGAKVSVAFGAVKVEPVVAR